MLPVSSAMKGYAIAAKDETIGTVSDFLFDQTTWTARWLVVDTGKWLTGRKVLVHPSAIDHVDHERRQIDVALTRKQVEDSPDIRQDRPPEASVAWIALRLPSMLTEICRPRHWTLNARLCQPSAS